MADLSNVRVGDLAQAIDTLFDRGNLALPVYVSRTPSVLCGLVVAGLVVYAGWPYVEQDRKDQAQAEVLALKVRWTVLLAVLAGVSYACMQVVQDRVFMFAMVSANRQHFANVYWIKEYTKHLRQ